jgi:hypothetical protein
MATRPPKKAARKPIPTKRTAAEQFADSFTGLEAQLLSLFSGIPAWVKSLLSTFSSWMSKHARPRTVAVWITPALSLAALWLTDPDRGMLVGKVTVSPVFVWLLMIVKGCAYVAIAHFLAKAIFDYPEADRQSLFGDAKKGNVASAIALAVQAAIFLGLIFFLAAQAHAEVPKQAQPYLPLLKAERVKHWSDDPAPHVLGGLIDHESGCPNPRKCWNPRTEFNGKFKGTDIRSERGVGFGQITIAWRRDGSVRMDALQDMVNRHPALAGWSWQNVYDPGYQLRAMVLMSRDNFMALRAVRDPMQRIKFADAAYNGGLGGVRAERRACALQAGCDPQRWGGNVERVCLKSKVALYGQRSACDINRFHVVDVVEHRAPKYRGLV